MIHVLTLSVFVGTAVMIDLRLLGRTLTHVPASQVIARLLPWSQAGFVVMVVTGTLLFYASPLARYENMFFRMKMVALVMAVANAWAFRRTAYRRVAEWDLDPIPPRRVRVTGALSLTLLAIIITTGRMMAYSAYWFG